MFREGFETHDFVLDRCNRHAFLTPGCQGGVNTNLIDCESLGQQFAGICAAFVVQTFFTAGDLLGAIERGGHGAVILAVNVGILHGDRFIPMPVSSNDIGQHIGERGPEQSVFMAPASTRSAFSAAAALDCGAVIGTVDAEMKPVELHFYGSGARPLTLGAPLGSAAVRKLVKPSSAAVRVRANDLIGELREISGQVNRMMAQVERAIDRLAIHAR